MIYKIFLVCWMILFVFSFSIDVTKQGFDCDCITVELPESTNITNTTIEPTPEPTLESHQPEFLPRIDGWTCYDYTTQRNNINPEWNILLLGRNARFLGGDNHFVNYKINEDKDLIIHDELFQNEYISRGWQLDTYRYYHFYKPGEHVTRLYRYKIDNKREVYNSL